MGLAAWFGGSLMGAVGVNGAADDLPDHDQRLRVASAGWARWSPVNAAAMSAHLVGAAGMLSADADRVRQQPGAVSASTVKPLLTVAALGATACSGWLGRQVAAAQDAPAAGAVEPTAGTPAPVASAQTRLKAFQWLVPVLTGALVVVSALKCRIYEMTQNRTARSTVAYLIVRDQAHENAYAKALEALGVEWNKLLPIPKTNAERFPEVKTLLDQGLASKQYTFSLDQLSEAGRIFQGDSPSKDGTTLSTEQAPEGVPFGEIASERPEEFGPGLDPELMSMAQAVAEMEMAGRQRADLGTHQHLGEPRRQSLEGLGSRWSSGRRVSRPSGRDYEFTRPVTAQR